MHRITRWAAVVLAALLLLGGSDLAAAQSLSAPHSPVPYLLSCFAVSIESVSPEPLVTGQKVDVVVTLRNTCAAPASGKLDAKIDNQALIGTAGSSDISALAQGAVFTGHFWTSSLAPGAHSLVAEFQQVQGWNIVPNGPGGLQWVPNYVVVGSDSRSLTVMPQHPVLPRYNEVAFTATHNSYWVKRDNVLEIEASGTQERLVDQALFEGVRSMELDLHRDDTTPHAFTVYHTDKESNSLCPQLADCLKELLVLQHALPDHDPVTLVLEFKEITFEDMFDSASHTPADLDSALEQYLGPYLYRPRDQMGRCSGASNLRQCVATAGWPTLDQLRGKFIVTVIGNYNAGASGCPLGGVVVHNERAWVTYGTSPGGPLARSAFLMESPWATPNIACQENIPQPLVDAAVNNAPFVQLEVGKSDELYSTKVQGWIHSNYVTRADVGQNNQPTLDDQHAIVRAGSTLIQNDYPWFSIGSAPLRNAIPLSPPPDASVLNEPGHRTLFVQKTPGTQSAAAYQISGAASSRWETTVATTRPTTSAASPNPGHPRGSGCLYASTPSDAAGNFLFGMRVCRGTADGNWLTGKPLDEDAVITVDVAINGVLTTSTQYSDDRDANGLGEMLRLDVSQTPLGGATVSVYSSGGVVNDTPQWRLVRTQWFPTALVEQGLAARGGDVLFVGTRRGLAYAPVAPSAALTDVDTLSRSSGGYDIRNLSWSVS
jgi:hypothetical protein